VTGTVTSKSEMICVWPQKVGNRIASTAEEGFLCEFWLKLMLYRLAGTAA